jgi:glycosyltransferase involved in cell wall biosynthesis
MKSIALISEHASPLADPGGVDSGGQNVYVAQVAAFLAARGYDVDVFTRRDDPDLPEISGCPGGCRVIRVAAGPPRFVKKEELLPYMNEFTVNMMQYCSEKTYHIIHANFWMSGLVAVNIKRLLRIPFVITFHALGRIRRIHQSQADKFPDERFAIEDVIVRECDGIIAECPQDRADMITYYEADSAKICVIPCGFDPAEIYPVDKAIARRVLGLTPDAAVILQLGRIVPRKGIDTAIRGFARFVRERSVNARLVIVGGATREPDPVKDPEIGRLQAIAGDEAVADRVAFTGRASRDELKYYFSAADVFITTPWYEPFGITPLESMACGTPVIGANVGGIKFTVKDSVTGCLIPPNDPRAVTESLCRLYDRPGVLKEMGKNAIERVNKMFTWEIVTNKIIGFYRKVVQRAAAIDYGTELTFSGLQEAAANNRNDKENNICNL